MTSGSRVSKGRTEEGAEGEGRRGESVVEECEVKRVARGG